MQPSQYEAVVERIYDLQKFRGKISLDPIEELTTALGDPQRGFDSIHVAGTNGKGSTATLLAAVLRQAGYRVGLFTSPHLTDFRERIIVDGEKIPREKVVEHFAAIEEADVDISFFECMAALAFRHFAERDVDVAVIETGMGGRVDATNVIDPELSVITNVAREHTRWLGESPAAIAYELAGIVAEDTPVVSGADGTPGKVIAAEARRRDAEVIEADAGVSAVEAGGTTLLLDVDGEWIPTELVGRYQVDNVNAVLSAVEALDREVPDEAVRVALETTDVPGRMEIAARDPLLLLDGAHNPAAVDRLPATMDAIGTDRVVGVVSIMADKDYPEMLDTLQDVADVLVLSEAGIDRAADPADLATHVDRVDHEVHRSIPDALATARALADPADAVLATGSLYFVGDVKRVFEDQARR